MAKAHDVARQRLINRNRGRLAELYEAEKAKLVIPRYKDDSKTYIRLMAHAKAKAVARLCREQRGELHFLIEGAERQGYERKMVKR